MTIRVTVTFVSGKFHTFDLLNADVTASDLARQTAIREGTAPMPGWLVFGLNLPKVLLFWAPNIESLTFEDVPTPAQKIVGPDVQPVSG